MNTAEIIQNQLFGLLFEINAQLRKAIKESPHNVTPMQQKTLGFFYNFPGSSQQEFVDRLGRDKAQVTRLIKDLEERELLNRVNDPKDNRSYKIHLSKKGVTVFKQVRKLENKVFNKLLSGFEPEDLEYIQKVFSEMRSNLQSS
jgi:DNA-binding MarR family transcriptional regulator